MLVNGQGEIIEGWPMINQAGFCIHSAIHHARPDVICAAHTHPPAGSSYGAGRAVGSAGPDGLLVFRGSRGVLRLHGHRARRAAGKDIVGAIGNKRALILANHGLLTTGVSVEQALIDMLDMERTCTVNLRALATGRPLQVVPPEVARQSRSVLTQPMRYPFQWETLVRELDRHETDYNPWR